MRTNWKIYSASESVKAIFGVPPNFVCCQKEGVKYFIMSVGEEGTECPLCMEPLELDDINFFPCTCGYQICRFCWHRIRTDENGLCPACRKAYPEDPAEFKPLTEDELQRIKKERRQKEAQRKQKAAENRKHLANVRVVQRNLVFVVGLSQRLADPEVLRKPEYFGKFGKMHKVVINQSTSYAGAQVNGPSASAYVTYQRPEDALKAIQVVNNIHIEGRTLKASLGTTKYCSHFLRGAQCPKPDCMYLHELGEEAASFTKEEMQQGKHQEYEQKLYEQFMNTQNLPSQVIPSTSGKGQRKKNRSPVQQQGSPGSSSSGASSSASPGVEGGSAAGSPPKDAWPSLGAPLGVPPMAGNHKGVERLTNGNKAAHTSSSSSHQGGDDTPPLSLDCRPAVPTSLQTLSSDSEAANRLSEDSSQDFTPGGANSQQLSPNHNPHHPHPHPHPHAQAYPLPHHLHPPESSQPLAPGYQMNGQTAPPHIAGSPSGGATPTAGGVAAPFTSIMQVTGHNNTAPRSSAPAPPTPGQIPSLSATPQVSVAVTAAASMATGMSDAGRAALLAAASLQQQQRAAAAGAGAGAAGVKVPPAYSQAALLHSAAVHNALAASSSSSSSPSSTAPLSTTASAGLRKLHFEHRNPNDSMSLFSSNGFPTGRHPKSGPQPPALQPAQPVDDAHPPEIPDTMPAVSSSTDWQAAFGFSSAPIAAPAPTAHAHGAGGGREGGHLEHDDDLGFDPWDESSKALAEIMETEGSGWGRGGLVRGPGEQPPRLMGQQPPGLHLHHPHHPHHPHHHPHNAHHPSASPSPAPHPLLNGPGPGPGPHALPLHRLQPQGGDKPKSLPPGFAPNHLGALPNHPMGVSTSKMLGLMNIPPLPTSLSSVNTYHDGPGEVDLMHHADSRSNQCQNRDAYSVKDWQEGLRALLPNINISFGGAGAAGSAQQSLLSNGLPGNTSPIRTQRPPASNTQPHRPHNTQWTPQTNTQPELSWDPAIVTSGHVADNLMTSGEEPHWMASLHHLTEDSGNHRPPLGGAPEMAFPQRSASAAGASPAWPTASMAPPPGFHSPLNRPPPPAAAAATSSAEGFQ